MTTNEKLLLLDAAVQHTRRAKRLAAASEAWAKALADAPPEALVAALPALAAALKEAE